jgi:hypothetical protein
MKQAFFVVFTALTITLSSTISYGADNIILRMTDFSQNVESLVIHESGLADINYRAGGSDNITLKRSTIQRLRSYAYELSNVKVEDYTERYVCKIMVLPYSTPELEVSGLTEDYKFTGELRLIFIQTSCAQAYKLYPSKPEDKANAQATVDVLSVLAAELGKGDLR